MYKHTMTTTVRTDCHCGNYTCDIRHQNISHKRRHCNDRNLSDVSYSQKHNNGSSYITSSLSKPRIMPIIMTAMLVAIVAFSTEGIFYDNAYAQAVSSSVQQPIANHIVINEIDTNPPGKISDNIFDWIELYNPTASQVDIGGWKIASTTGTKKVMTIPLDTIIKPNQFITYANQQMRFVDINEVVELRDTSGVIIDKTPKITDTSDDHRSWQRIYDGYVLNGNNVADWEFGTQSPGSSNGKAPLDIGKNQVTIAIMTDKESYNFGQTVIISGNVSERKFIEKPHFMSEKITLQIIGPNYDNTVTLYPGLKLDFSTTLDLQKVHNIDNGTYRVSANYAGSTTLTSFTVGAKQAQHDIVQVNDVSVTTDAKTYTRSQEVIITGTTLQDVLFATFKITVVDPNGTIISSGNVTPIDGKVKNIITLDTIKPVYGTYVVTAVYADKKATTTFELTSKSKYDTQITLTADQLAYAQGQSVTISGMMHNVWTQTLDVKVLQTKQGAIIDKGIGGHTGFKIDASVRVSGDGSFEYSFDIPNNTQSLGDYKITFTGDIGSSGIVISVVNDVQSFVPNTDDPLTVYTDKTTYAQNDDVIFTGYIKDTPTGTTTQYATNNVLITITDEQGDTVQSYATNDDIQRGFVDNSGVVTYEIKSIPEESGRYTAKMRVLASVFESGNYTATAAYQGHKTVVSFTVFNQYDIPETRISLDKEVYGLGETITLKGAFSNTAANHVFVTLIKPDGSTIRSSATISDQQFTWEWDVPRADRTHSIKEGELRGVTLSVFGVYKLKIFTDTESKVAYFKLSEDPENDSLSDTPLFVTTSKTLYTPGDKLVVSGNVLLNDQSSENLRESSRVTIIVDRNTFPYDDIYEARVYPDIAGAFSSEFTLPVTIFKEGSYRVTALYNSIKATALFSTANNYVVSASEPISLRVETDKDTYNPGQTVTITGGPNKIIFLDRYDVSVSKKTGDEIDCGTFVCGAHSSAITRIGPDSTASFTHQFAIPQGAKAIGTYEVTVEASIGIKRVTFDVEAAEQIVDTSDIQNSTETVTSLFIPEVIIDRYNRLPETEFEIETYQNSTLQHGNNNGTVQASPVSLIGSVITTRGQESSVNLQVSTSNGTCIIGQEIQTNECMISESTSSKGRVFDVVYLDDGTALRVIYSGADERLERFAIYAGGDSEFLPDMTWNVKVINSDSDEQQQISRFYYKVTYKTIPSE